MLKDSDKADKLKQSLPPSELHFFDTRCGWAMAGGAQERGKEERLEIGCKTGLIICAPRPNDQ